MGRIKKKRGSLIIYLKPEKATIIDLDEHHRIEAGKYTWIFARRSANNDRYRFKFSSSTLLGLLYLIKEYCMKRSNETTLPEALETADSLIEEAMRSHAAFLREYLPKELKANKVNKANG